jgi:lysophospholipase L1-like esterase
MSLLTSAFRKIVLTGSALACGISTALAQAPTSSRKFDFGGGAPAPGVTRVQGDQGYSPERGYGFEPGATIRAVDDGSGSGFVTSDKLFKFSVAVPEGNYRVTVTLGDLRGESTTTVKAETRRLMLERIHTDSGKMVTRSFLVNVRTPAMPPGNILKLDTREIDPQTHAAITPTWDDRLTLQFSDSRPCVRAIEITPVTDRITVFLIGDSTVTDQTSEPYDTWGQDLPRWFNSSVAIADYAESGETLKAFRAQRRWDKVMTEMKPGDYVFIQFGHNDLNQKGHDGIWPRDDTMGDWAYTYSEANTDYKWQLATDAIEVKRRGGIPVIVSPMTKINLRTGALNLAGLGDYPKASIEAAKMADVACIDLNAMSIDVATALGPQLAPKAYVDGLHTNAYGGYLLARCIVEGIRQAHLGLANDLVEDAGSFDPKHPQPLPADFNLPLEPRPPGLGARRGPRPPTAPAPSAPDGSAAK